ncbi:MAG: hypothetical protein STSR0009_26610 [Methanoregula sp.]
MVATTEFVSVSITLTDLDKSLEFVTYAFRVVGSIAILVGFFPTGIVEIIEFVSRFITLTVAGSPFDHPTLFVT